MKFIASLMIILCATTVSFAQTVKKEVVVTKGEDGKEEKIVKKYKVITTKDFDIEIDSDDKKDSTIKKIMEVLSEIEEGDEIDSKVIVKTIDISDDDSSSYKVKILSDGEVKTIESSEDIDLEKVKIKIKELSSKLGDDDETIELVLKTINEIEEKEEKKEKGKKKKN